MRRLHNKKLVPLAKNLRKDMTKEERWLWYDFLRRYPVKILRQKVIGDYIADFYCPEAKLVIEVDGIHHNMDPESMLHDADRTIYFQQYGIAVCRVSNVSLRGEGFGFVCDRIDSTIQSRIEKLKKNNSISPADR